MNVSYALGNAGACPKVEHNGKTYTCSFVIQRVKAAYRQKMINRALSPLLDLEGKAPRDFIDRQAQAVLKRAENGEFDFSPESLKRIMSSGSVDSLAILVSILFDCSDDEATDLILNKTTETTVAIEQVWKGSFAPPE